MSGRQPPESIRWFHAHPDRLNRELDAMRAVAPDLNWDPDTHRDLPWRSIDGGCWHGTAPVWPFDRPAPEQLNAFLDGQRLRLVVACRQAHPAIAPVLRPLDPTPDAQYRTMHAWHISGDGTLCLTQRAYDWTGRELAAELVVKAAGWLLEYLLLSRGIVEAMTTASIAASDELDHLITAANAAPHHDESVNGYEGEDGT